MKLGKILITGLLGVTLGGSVNLANYINVNASSNTAAMAKKESAVKVSAKKLVKLGLTGKWYNTVSKNKIKVIDLSKDGTLNWMPINKYGNNTTVTGVQSYKGWNRLTISYPDNSKLYGFVKIGKIKINNKTYKTLLFATSKKKSPKLIKGMISTKSKVVLPKGKSNFKVKL